MCIPPLEMENHKVNIAFFNYLTINKLSLAFTALMKNNGITHNQYVVPNTSFQNSSDILKYI